MKKRQKSMVGNGKATTKKKMKKEEVGKEKEEVGKVVVEEQSDAAAPAEVLMGWDEWPGLWGVVDEQMSWGSLWCPFWGIDETYNEMYDDVWDGDVWNLKGINEVPSP